MARSSRMRRETRVAVGVLGLLLLSPSICLAAKARWAGTVASDQGVVLAIHGKLRQIAPGHWIGALKCRPAAGVGRCLSKRISVTALISGGTFTAAIALSKGVQCAAQGAATGSNLQGDYACVVGGLTVDSGFFTLGRL